MKTHSISFSLLIVQKTTSYMILNQRRKNDIALNLNSQIGEWDLFIYQTHWSWQGAVLNLKSILNTLDDFIKIARALHSHKCITEELIFRLYSLRMGK